MDTLKDDWIRKQVDCHTVLYPKLFIYATIGAEFESTLLRVSKCHGAHSKFALTFFFTMIVQMSMLEFIILLLLFILARNTKNETEHKIYIREHSPSRILTDYRDGMQYVLDQTLRLMNKGIHPDDLQYMIQLPAKLKTNPYLFEHYGTLKWSIRGIMALLLDVEYETDFITNLQYNT